MTRAVFLDRDETLIECHALPAPPPPAKPGDTIDPALVALLPGTLNACIRLRRAGWRLVIVSNQGTVARGGAPLRQIEHVNDAVRAALPDPDATPLRSLVDAAYFCPFHPVGIVPAFTREHPWRKPGGGMLLSAAAELGIDLDESWMVGDSARDVDAGLAAGLPRGRCLRVGPEGNVPDLAAAADLILAAPR